MFVLYEKGGSALTFLIGGHIDASQLLKTFAFAQKSEIKLPSKNRGGFAGIRLS